MTLVRRRARRALPVLFVFAGLLAGTAEATPIQVNITVDNSYALFYGTETAATNFVGSDFDWGTTETHNFDLPDNFFIYVVTASDVSVAQGFLGQFENLSNGNKFYSNDPQWQVMATGLGSAAPYTGSSADLALLSQEIVDANGGGNASNGWVGTTAGPGNVAPNQWGPRPGIDSVARWVWYSSNGDTDPTTPGFDHDEWLVFRIPVAAAPVPEPSTVVLMLLGAAGVLGLRRRRARRS